ncbi:hypothetical protein M758_1G117700 [Ceratodon purpureus]|nr:hypothetical protein M758_1G117700 [Ceratodon purpureus]
MASLELRSLPQMYFFFCCSGVSPSRSECYDKLQLEWIRSLAGGSSTWSWLALYLLTPCPQRALLSILHLFFLSLYILRLIYQGMNQKPQPHGFRHGVGMYFRVVQGCCLYLLCINLGVLLFWLVDGFQYGWSGLPLDVVVSAGTQSVAWGVIYIGTEETRKGRHQFFPTLLNLWWISAFLLSTLILLSSILFASWKGAYLGNVVVHIILYPAALFLAYVGFRGRSGIEMSADEQMEEPLLNGAEHEKTEREHVELYENAGFFSLAAFSWLDHLLRVGRRKPLEIKDLPPLPPEDSTEAMYEKFKSNWDDLKQKKPEETPSLSLTLWNSFWPLVVVNAMFAFVNVLASYVGPYLINDFVEYLGGRRRFEHEGLTLVLVFSFGKLIENLAQRQWYYGIQYLCLKVEAALTVVVYWKALRLSNSARQSHTSGEIINYMSVDVKRISDFGWYLHRIWILPVEVSLALAILNRVVGMAWLAALVAAVVTLLLNTPLEKLQEKYQAAVMEAKDKRMKALSECLKNMRVLKLQSWEQRFLLRIEELRQSEYGWLFKDAIARALQVYIFWLAPVVISVSTFGACVLFGIPLTSGRILSAIATFRVLQEALSQFPELVSYIAQTRVSLERIWTFLQEEELPTDSVIHVPAEESGGIAIEIEDGEFNWHSSDTELRTLTGINLRIKRGSRVAVCGTVGSGKTSLLSSILGEIPKLAGTVKVSGTTAYVAQSAWIQTGKVEDNIRFGKPMNRNLYESILSACSLRKDLELWAFGDQTEIGERGINMSGGQKQRIQLARALYQDTDVYLLDDPFSAVDAHTGAQLFQECILGMLASKTVVYVTHQIEFLPAADLILVLDKGTVVQAGKYDDLLQAGTNFQTLVNAHNEAIDGMDVQELFEDGELTIAEEPSGIETYLAGSELQKQASLRKSSSVAMRKQASKREDDKLETTNRQLIDEEERETGSVGFGVYWAYATAVYKGALVAIVIVCQFSFMLLQLASNFWMAWAAPAREGDTGKASSTKLILVYTVLSVTSSLFVIVRSLSVYLCGLFISQKYFMDMVRCIFRAPMSFFDSTPVGRILNRASTDQTRMDMEIPSFLGSLASVSIQLVGVVVVMSAISWNVLLFFLPIVILVVWLQRYYMSSAREVARVMGIEKSPVLNHYGESIAGAATIRGFGQNQRFLETNIELFNVYARPAFLNFALIEWLIFRMELLCSIIFAFSLMIVLSFSDSIIDPSISGLAVTYGLNLNILIGWTIWTLCNVETRIISFERIQQYTRIESEPPLVIEEKRPAPSWPSEGTIQLQRLELRYTPRSPLVLHGITCTFHGGEKIGVVGRTGSGKSTLIQALFRMVEPSGGKIIIDGVDITTIGLHDLRTRLSIIPQDPTLFEGTMRSNLDPLLQHTDMEVWEALDKCQLGDVVRGKDGKLDAVFGENADNWSVGQRQLVCLGRALLKRTRILVLDEATASVDSATDNVIQRTLRTEFKDCTVVTIAHRIPTVVDSDKVLVLSDGRIAEFDTPATLLENKNSLFTKLVAEYSARSTK